MGVPELFFSLPTREVMQAIWAVRYIQGEERSMYSPWRFVHLPDRTGQTKLHKNRDAMLDSYKGHREVIGLTRKILIESSQGLM